MPIDPASTTPPPPTSLRPRAHGFLTRLLAGAVSGNGLVAVLLGALGERGAALLAELVEQAPRKRRVVRAPKPFIPITKRLWYRMLCPVVLTAMVVATVVPYLGAADQTWDGGTAGSGTAWLTGTNWAGDPTNANVPGSTTVNTNTDVATFVGVGGTTTGINMNFTGNTYGLGAIVVTAGTRNIGNSSGTAGTLRLNGATVNGVANVILRNSGTGVFTLQASQSGTMSVALGNATNNIINIDGSGGINITAVLKDGPAAAKLTLAGSGTGALTLSGANTYTGGTVIATGNLVTGNGVGTSATGTGGVTVGNNTGVATLSGTGYISGLVTTATTGSNVAHLAPGVNTGTTNVGAAGTLRLNGGLTIGSGTVLDFDLFNTTAGTSDLITLGNTVLTFPTSFTFNFNMLVPGSLATTGTYTLISGASNALSLSGVTITPTGLEATTYTATFSVSGGSLLVHFDTPGGPATANYFDTNGSTAGIGIFGTATPVWDTTTTNWNPVVTGDGVAKTYDASQTAYFGVSGTGAHAGVVSVIASGVNVNGGIQFDADGYTIGDDETGGALTFAGITPNITVTNAAHTATIHAPILGTVGLNKLGPGTLVLDSVDSTFTGSVNVNAGTLSISANENLGDSANPVVFAGGTLLTTLGFNSTHAMTVTALGGGGTFDTNGFDTSVGGATTINDAFNKKGDGNLTLTGSLSFGAGAALTVSGGALVLGQSGGTINLPASGAVLNGNLVVKGGAFAPRVNFSGAYTGTGQIQVPKSGASLATTGTATPTIGNDIVLNSLALDEPFSTNLGAVSGSTITINGVISGNSALNFAAGGSSGGAGTVILNAKNTYLGDTRVNLSSTGVVKLGIDDALPTTTSLIFNTVTGNSATGGTIDLNGHNQTVAALSYNAASTAGGSVATNYKITNTGTVDAVFTVNGSTTPTNGFAGVISSGTTNKTSLVKDGTNTLTLSATNTYTGTTSVQGGALIVSGSISASSLTTVSGTGTLGGGGTVGALTVASGGTVSPGSSPGTLNAGATILQSGGRYKLELASDGTGAAGTDWDQLAVTGTLNLSGLSSGARFILKLQTLDSSNANADGSLVSWDGSVNHTWTSIITTTLGVTGFSADKFLVDTSGFANFFPGVFGVVLNGNNLDLQYLAVPEPSAALSLIVGAGTLLGFRRRRIA